MAEGVEQAAKHWMRPIDFHINIKCKPITIEEPIAELESKTTETWQKLHGHAIVAGEWVQEKINESVTCRFCQGSIELQKKKLKDNTSSWTNWIITTTSRSFCRVHC